MIVREHGQHGKIADFDPATGQLQASVEALPMEARVERESGSYAQLGDHLAVFYRHQGQLSLRVGSVTLSIDEHSQIDWRLVETSQTDPDQHLYDDGLVQLTLHPQDTPPIVLTYRSGPTDGIPLAEDPTPFISYEDWDLGLFVANCITDGRLSRLYPDASAGAGVTEQVATLAVRRILGDQVTIEIQQFPPGALGLTLRRGPHFATVDGAADGSWGVSVDFAEAQGFEAHDHTAATLDEALKIVSKRWTS